MFVPPSQNPNAGAVICPESTIYKSNKHTQSLFTTQQTSNVGHAASTILITRLGLIKR